MKKKIITLFFGIAATTFSLSAQTIRDNIDKQAEDKSTMDMAAKADVLILPKTISNTTQVKSDVKKDTQTAVQKIKSTKNKHKKKYTSSSK